MTHFFLICVTQAKSRLLKKILEFMVPGTKQVFLGYCNFCNQFKIQSKSCLVSLMQKLLGLHFISQQERLELHLVASSEFLQKQEFGKNDP